MSFLMIWLKYLQPPHLTLGLLNTKPNISVHDKPQLLHQRTFLVVKAAGKHHGKEADCPSSIHETMAIINRGYTHSFIVISAEVKKVTVFHFVRPR